MADSVQHVLDRMVKDLEDLRYRGIFSEVSDFGLVSGLENNILVNRHASFSLMYNLRLWRKMTGILSDQ